MKVSRVVVQLFIDDFQSPSLNSRFTARVSGKRWEQLEAVLATINQTGPIGNLVTVDLGPELASIVTRGSAKLLIDDATSGVGDGYAIDFIRVLINPHSDGQQGRLSGHVIDDNTLMPIPAAVVRVGSTSATVDGDGAYTISGVPAGLAVVSASAPGYARSPLSSRSRLMPSRRTRSWSNS